MARFLDHELDAFGHRFLRQVNGRLSLRENTLGDCVFFDSQARACRVYPVRPHQCRTYPFWPSILATSRTWETESARCPGIGASHCVSHSQIQSQIQAWLCARPGGTSIP